jgi:catalase
MRVDGNYGAAVSYQPNSKNEWGQQLEYQEPPLSSCGDVYHYEPKDDQADDCFDQPGRLFRLMTEEQKQALVNNTNANMTQNGICVTPNIRLRHAAHCYLADEDYGRRLAMCMELDLAEVQRLAGLCHAERMASTI